MKRWTLISSVLGLLAVLALVILNDGARVLHLIATQGAGLIAVTFFHLFPLLLSAAAWRSVSTAEARPGPFAFFEARALREAVNDLLPVAQVGGAIAGVRPLILRGRKAVPVFAAMFVDMTLESASQVVFVLIGVALLTFDGRAPAAASWALFGAALLALGLVGFLLLQRSGALGFVDRMVRRALARLGADIDQPTEHLHDAVVEAYRKRSFLLTGFGLHLLCWIVGASEVWLALHFMEVNCTIKEALILESLGTAIRSAAFIIPGGLGVQEGGYIVLCAAFGIDAQTALALSLTKRVREVAIGGVSLVEWHVIESRHLMSGLTPR